MKNIRIDGDRGKSHGGDCGSFSETVHVHSRHLPLRGSDRRGILQPGAIQAVRGVFQELFRKTLFRAVMVALVVGGAIAQTFRRWAVWPIAAFLALRPYVSPVPVVQTARRVLVWFAGGVLLTLGVRLTASVFDEWHSLQGLTWWLEGVVFFGVELVIILLCSSVDFRTFTTGVDEI